MHHDASRRIHSAARAPGLPSSFSAALFSTMGKVPCRLSAEKRAALAYADQQAGEEDAIAELSDLCRANFGLAAKAGSAT